MGSDRSVHYPGCGDDSRVFTNVKVDQVIRIKKEKQKQKWIKSHVLNICSLSCVNYMSIKLFKNVFQHLPGGSVDKNPPANPGDMSSIPGLGKFCLPQSC